jgi:hypothetical protein
MNAIEEVRLQGGRGDGMRLLQVRCASGLEVTVSADRAADLSRVIYKGDNMGYFSPCGYVSPAYYDGVGDGFLKSFTAGFLTTCGLTAVGSPCTDNGETLPLHGTIANTPAERLWWEEEDDAFHIHATVRDCTIFSHKLVLNREIVIGKRDSRIRVSDTITNEDTTESPLMLLYHLNIGHPLLSEETVVEIDSDGITPRNAHAAEGLATWSKMLSPTPGFEEQCYYHRFDRTGRASVYNPAIRKALEIAWDPSVLDHFCQWKMMGVHDYVLGLEPGNCTADGRDVMRAQGELKFLSPGASQKYEVEIIFKEM